MDPLRTRAYRDANGNVTETWNQNFGAQNVNTGTKDARGYYDQVVYPNGTMFYQPIQV